MMLPADFIFNLEIKGKKSKDEIKTLLAKEEEYLEYLRDFLASPYYHPDEEPSVTTEMKIKSTEEFIKLARAELRRIEEGEVA